jgi:hypothetical protein
MLLSREEEEPDGNGYHFKFMLADLPESLIGQCMVLWPVWPPRTKKCIE